MQLENLELTGGGHGPCCRWLSAKQGTTLRSCDPARGGHPPPTAKASAWPVCALPTWYLGVSCFTSSCIFFKPFILILEELLRFLEVYKNVS